ncbi:MAG: hypothetical protein IJN49_04660 [Clostridia bacterium]|nr:hypothetical protein [Clostridia bacterium]
MNKYVKEYIRIINSMGIDEVTKECIKENVLLKAELQKRQAKKQMAVASVAVVALAFAGTYFYKNKMK